MTTIGITLLAIALPAGIVLMFLAVTKLGDTRRFQLASAVAFLALGLWNSGSAIVRATQGDFGMMLGLEALLGIGFTFQAWWTWKAKI